MKLRNENETNEQAGRSSGRSTVFIHSHTHTYTFHQLYKLVYGNYLDAVYTDIPHAQLSRDRALAWQPFSLQLWQIVAAHTHTHIVMLARGRALLAAFFEPSLFYINYFFSEIFLPIMMIFNWRILPELSAWSLSWALRLKADVL